MGELIKPHVLNDLLTDWSSFLELPESRGAGPQEPAPQEMSSHPEEMLSLPSLAISFSFFSNMTNRVKSWIKDILERVLTEVQ